MKNADKTLRQFSGYSMKRAFNAIRADVNATLEPFQLRMVTFSALVIIVDNPGLRQSQLAEILSMERPNVVLIVDELESRELIMRKKTPDDRRAYALQVTLAGRRLHDRALEAVKQHEKKMTEGLTERERLALLKALCLIEENGRNEANAGEISRS